MNEHHKLIANTIKQRAIYLNRHIDYIEVGVFKGDSALSALRTERLRIAVLIDNWSNTYCGPEKSSRAFVEQLLVEYQNIVYILEGSSRDMFPYAGGKFDIGFVDGDHSDAGCRFDMENMLPLIRSNGIMFVDDLRNPAHLTLEQVVKDFAAEHKLSFKYHEVHHGLAELRR